MVNWTQIVLALISTIGTVLTAVFASRAKANANDANDSAVNASMHAEVAKAASLRPGKRGDA